jgi:small ligand-binding sensory domain FIST
MTSRPFQTGHASGADAEAVVEACLAQIGEVAPDANLGFVYASDVLADALGEIVAALSRRTGIDAWVGTVGLGVIATGREYYDTPALAVMLADFGHDEFALIPTLNSDPLGEFPEGLAAQVRSDGSALALLHADPNAPATPSLIATLGEQLPELFCVGGLSASQSSDPQVVGSSITQGGISGVVFRNKVPVAVNHTQGCTPIGPRHRISRAERNIAITLDDQPALQLLKDDVGEVFARDLQRMAGYIFAGLVIPGSDTGDYTVRQLIGVDQERGLLAVGDMLTEGRELMFCRRDGNSATEDLKRMLDELASRCAGRIRGGIYVSCTGRGRYQFGHDAEEVKAIQATLGDFPLVGFFANGEIYNNRLYGFTGVLTLFLSK